MTGIWGTIPITETFKLKIGTPVFFDIGVYCVVLGVTLTIILALSDQEKETD